MDAPPLRNEAAPPRRVRMKDVQGMPGTSTGLGLRVCQFVATVISLTVMATTSDFPSVTSFRYTHFFFFFTFFFIIFFIIWFFLNIIVCFVKVSGNVVVAEISCVK